MTDECPECGEEYRRREEFDPGEGPNRSDETVECFYHTNYKFCSREVDHA